MLIVSSHFYPFFDTLTVPGFGHWELQRKMDTLGPLEGMPGGSGPNSYQPNTLVLRKWGVSYFTPGHTNSPHAPQFSALNQTIGFRDNFGDPAWCWFWRLRPSKKSVFSDGVDLFFSCCPCARHFYKLPLAPGAMQADYSDDEDEDPARSRHNYCAPLAPKKDVCCIALWALSVSFHSKKSSEYVSADAFDSTK